MSNVLVESSLSVSVNIPFICILFRESSSVNQIVTEPVLSDKLFGIKSFNNEESTVPVILLCDTLFIQELLPYSMPCKFFIIFIRLVGSDSDFDLASVSEITEIPAGSIDIVLKMIEFDSLREDITLSIVLIGGGVGVGDINGVGVLL